MLCLDAERKSDGEMKRKCKEKKKKIHAWMLGRGKKGENFLYCFWLNEKGKKKELIRVNLCFFLTCTDV
jgi:hypothetical protein